MKRWIVLLLTAMLLAVWCPAMGEEAGTETDTNDLLRVGTTTAFSGNFFSGAIGNNVSDQDVRKLIHGYNLVEWVPQEGVFRPNQQVVTAFSSSQDGSSFIFAINDNLRYNDGTPITARDYAFSFLLQTSQALQEAAGTRLEGDMISGWKAYDAGEAAAVSGFRLIGDYQFSITISIEYRPYFYEMQALSLDPYPISVIAPGCEVKDDGNGIYLNGLTAKMLQETLLDPTTGYAIRPEVTCGPYQLVSFDGETAALELNPEYLGDANGQKPYIEEIIFRCVDADQLINELGEGNLDLVIHCARNDQIQAGMALTSSGDFDRYAYSRNGLGFISFCAEDGPTSDVRVRQALAMCMDKEEFKNKYLGSYGLVVNGYYGIGQWMFLASNGTITVENEGEELGEDEEPPTLSLNGLSTWSLSMERANELLDEAGWNLNEQGQPYDPETDNIRCRGNNGRLQKLHLKLICADNNRGGSLLPDYFGANLAAVGAELEIETMPMADLLQRYYHTIDRDCDMIMLGSNFGDVFEPSTEFEGDTHTLSGITDPEFKALALDLRKTEPGRALEYVQKWIKFLEYRSTILPEIPLYSNAYMDFAISKLQNYAPSNYSSWAEAIKVAMLSDVAIEDEFGEDIFNEGEIGDEEIEFTE